ncbi:MAG: DUF4157 domain-containing protein [Acidobacteriota bacterium]
MIQPKLIINQPGDIYEQEADRVVEQVMQMPSPAPVSQSPDNSRQDGSSIQSAGSYPEKDIQRNQPTIPPIVHEVLSSPGIPLDPATRAYMEPRFGHDFSRVRVHSGVAAEQSARDMNAKVYTMGHDVVFGAGMFAPETHQGRRIIAHELTHVMQQSYPNGIRFGTIQRIPAAPAMGDKDVPFDRSKVDVFAIPDIRADTDFQRLISMAKVAFVKFNDPNIKAYSSKLYDPSDHELSSSGINPVPRGSLASFPLFAIPVTGLTQGRHILRCIGYDSTNRPIAYADRSFYIWTSKPTGKPPDIAVLEARKTALEAITRAGSGKTFGEVASASAELMDVNQRLGVLETGTGPYVGSHCPIQPAGAKVVGCTNSVLIVLENVFMQQGRGADWDKLEKKINKNIMSHGKKLSDIEGEDIQAALQSEFGWKGIFWAPDPAYKIPSEELTGRGITGDEAGWAFGIAKKKGIYKEKGRPSVSIDYLVTNYAPEVPKAGHGEASKTKKDTTQLDKLKKLPFGVLSAHGATHMAFITYGKVIEVHWEKEATDIDLIETTDIEKWAVGPESGFHYFASGAIVAPAADIDAAFK